MKALLIIVGIVVALALLVALGLQITPRAFPPFADPSGPVTRMPVPDGLPVPVQRFYRELYGDEAPVVKSFVVSGRARLRIMGVTFPSRFRFTHVAGQDYRHYIETTLFGLPLMRVNEHYLNGRSRLDLPFGVEEGPQVDQGANLALWAESFWAPSILIADPSVRWQAIDEETSVLVVPFGEEEQRFVARFDPDTGLVRILESMRYKGTDSDSKTLWINEILEWGDIDGNPVPIASAVTWYDEGSPWAVFSVEEIRVNVEVDDYVKARGP